MEENKEYNSLQALITKLEQQLKSLEDVQKQDCNVQKKEIKERFEEAIHALEVKQQNLIDQLDTITTQHDTAIEQHKLNLRELLQSCQEIQKAGALVYKRNQQSAEQIWQGAQKLEFPVADDLTNLLSKIEVQIPTNKLHELVDSIVNNSAVSLVPTHPTTPNTTISKINSKPIFEVFAQNCTSAKEVKSIVAIQKPTQPDSAKNKKRTWVFHHENQLPPVPTEQKLIVVQKPEEVKIKTEAKVEQNTNDENKQSTETKKQTTEPKKLKRKQQDPAEPDEEYRVAAIVGKRISKKGREQYKVKWDGYSSSEDCWVDADDCYCDNKIQEFEEKERERRRERRASEPSGDKKKRGRPKKVQRNSSPIPTPTPTINVTSSVECITTSN